MMSDAEMFSSQPQMPSSVRVAAAQINPTVGDLSNNTQKIAEWMRRAREAGVQILVFPELSLCGYPPKDLLLKPKFIRDQFEELQLLIPESKGMLVLAGLVIRDGDSYNAAAILHDGELLGFSYKTDLPNYRVFDEKRYFRASEHLTAVQTDVASVGVMICEDLWHPETVASMAASGVDLIACLSSSPFSVGRALEREVMLRARCQDHSLGLVFANQVGGQDELIFDGRSLIVSPEGSIMASGAGFEEELVVADLRFGDIHRNRLAVPLHRESFLTEHEVPLQVFETQGNTQPYRGPETLTPPINPFSSQQHLTSYPINEAYEALSLGVRDYVHKNGFSNVVIGLSGGIDSALTAAIATEALGAENVVGVLMPSQFSSGHSVSDAEQLALNLGIPYKQFAIQAIYEQYLSIFETEFQNKPFDITEENLQSRIRGNILMALSNKFGWLVLATGNKSELSVGYATLYGDMCGGLAVIGDVPKTMVYALAEYCNQRAGREMIPENTIHKPPSAELRADQKDTDSLPPYDILDGILYAYIEQDCSIQEIAEMGYDAALVKKVVQLVDRSEYKRQQAAIVLRVTLKAFNSDRRLPVTNKYRSG